MYFSLFQLFSANAENYYYNEISNLSRDYFHYICLFQHMLKLLTLMKSYITIYIIELIFGDFFGASGLTQPLHQRFTAIQFEYQTSWNLDRL